MKTYRAIIQESFEDDTIKEIIFENQTIEKILDLFEKLDGKSFSELQIFPFITPYPHLHVIGGPDMFTFSLAKDKNIWQEIVPNPDPDKSKWRTFGVGYHNFKFFDDELCNKQVTLRMIKYFCETGEWIIAIPSQLKSIPLTS